MAVDFSGLFHKPNVNVDFSPIERGGAAMGNAYASIGQSVAHGLITRAKLQEERRQYDLQLAYKKTLQHAQDLRQQELDRHRAAVEARTEAHQGVMEQQGAERIGMEQQRIGQQDRAQGRLEMEARRRADEAAYKRIHLEAMAGSTQKLLDTVHERGDISDGEHMIGSQLIQSGDPAEIHKVATSIVEADKVKRQKLYDEDMRTRAPKELTKTLDEQRKAQKEAGINVDPESDLEVRRRIIDLGTSFATGKALEAEVEDVRKMIASPGKKSGADSNTIALPSGEKIPAPPEFLKGGRVDDLINDRKTLGWFQAAAQNSAQSDKRYPSEAALIQAASQGQGDAVLRQRASIVHEHAEQLLSRYGWTRDEAQRGTSMPNGASKTMSDTTSPIGPVTIESLKAKAVAEGWSKEQFFEAARKAGIK